MPSIKSLKAREIFHSRGNLTVKVDVATEIASEPQTSAEHPRAFAKHWNCRTILDRELAKATIDTLDDLVSSTELLHNSAK